jgi:regulatory protein
VHEGDSSSRSAKLSIVSIEKTEKKGARRGEASVQLSDGSSFFVLPDLLLAESLGVGDELLPADVERLRSLSLALSAERRALALLAGAPHSTQSLRLKLIQRGFPEPAVQEALARLREMGYLDDRKFAESWLTSRLGRRPEGAVVLAAGLMKRGVDRETAEEAVRDFLSPQDEEESVRRAAEKLLQSGRRDRRQLLARLIARGFRTSLAIRVLDELLPHRPEIDGEEY